MWNLIFLNCNLIRIYHYYIIFKVQNTHVQSLKKKEKIDCKRWLCIDNKKAWKAGANYCLISKIHFHFISIWERDYNHRILVNWTVSWQNELLQSKILLISVTIVLLNIFNFFINRHFFKIVILSIFFWMNLKILFIKKSLHRYFHNKMIFNKIYFIA